MSDRMDLFITTEQYQNHIMKQYLFLTNIFFYLEKYLNGYMHNGFSSKCMEGLLIKFYTPSLIRRLIFSMIVTQASFLKLNISTTRSGNHALILVFCLFVTVLFYLTHNTSENISYSLETNEMHIIIFDYYL